MAVTLLAYHYQIDWYGLKRKVLRSKGCEIKAKNVTLKLWHGFFVLILPQGTRLVLEKHGKD
jgi:hypothetical protein